MTNPGKTLARAIATQYIQRKLKRAATMLDALKQLHQRYSLTYAPTRNFAGLSPHWLVRRLADTSTSLAALAALGEGVAVVRLIHHCVAPLARKISLADGSGFCAAHRVLSDRKSVV